MIAISGINNITYLEHSNYRGETKVTAGANVSFADFLKDAQASKRICSADQKHSANPRNPYFAQAQDGMLSYAGLTFFCNEKNNALELGDVSNPKDVISIGLSNGGSIHVNKHDIADLLKCSGLFSAEDMDRIMAAYEKQKIAEQREKKIEDEMEDALVDRAS